MGKWFQMKTRKHKNLVVGCGLSGAIMARKIAEESGENVTVIDIREHIGGNCYGQFEKSTC
jgi:UDP-galactopyranose mutase